MGNPTSCEGIDAAGGAQDLVGTLLQPFRAELAAGKQHQKSAVDAWREMMLVATGGPKPPTSASCGQKFNANLLL
jgi:hypothetical protein